MALIRANSGSGGGKEGGAISFTIAIGGSDVKICDINDNSSGMIYFIVGGNYATWGVNGKTVNRINGTSTSTAFFYVTGDALYAHNVSSVAAASFQGTLYDVKNLHT